MLLDLGQLFIRKYMSKNVTAEKQMSSLDMLKMTCLKKMCLLRHINNDRRVYFRRGIKFISPSISFQKQA